MPTEKTLLDQRADVWAQMQEIRTSVDTDGWTPELRTAWDRAEGDLSGLETQIDDERRSKKGVKLEERFAEIDQDTIVVDGNGERGGPRERDGYRKAFEKFMRHGMTEIEPEEAALLRSNFSNLEGQERALGAGTGAAGGYTVPEGFWAKVTETQKMFGGAMDGAEVITTDAGNPLPWATNDDTAMIGYQLGENVEATNEGDLEFGKNQLEAFTFVSGVQKVSFALLQDSGIDIENFVAKKLGIRLGRIENLRLTSGNGTTQPQGYVTGLSVGKTTASATAFTYDEFIDLEHSVDAAYRNPAQCTYKFHDLVLAEMRKLRDDSGGDGVGRPLWQPAVTVGAPDTFNGYRYVVNNDQDSTVAATKKTVAFGNWMAAFVVRKVRGATMIRFGEKFADSLQVGFLAFERVDSLVQDPSAAKVLQQHA